MKRSVLVLGKLCGVLALASLAPPPAVTAAVPPAAAAAAGFAGIWRGAIVFQRGSIEGDMVLKLSNDAQGRLAGLCSLPVLGVVDHPILDVKPTGGQLAFVYKDDTGSSDVNLKLSEDGKHLDGEMVEKDKHYPLYLRRTSAEELEPRSPLVVLSSDAHELRERFDRDADKVRLVTFVSPSCHNCVRMVRLIQRYLLDVVNDPHLAVYVVWGPMLGGDSVEMAKQARVHLVDPRAVHLWAPDAELAKRFGVALHTDRPAWDVIFFFPPGARWTDPPQPADYVHTLGKQLPLDHQLDATLLPAKFQQLAAK
jgi:hypothetical protein